MKKSSTTTALGTGDIVFTDLKLYLSSGAKFMGTYYERGIQVRGKLAFFDRTGDFDGSFTDDGVVIKGGLDAFQIGGLEVTSLREEHNGRRRATMDVEVTKTRQRVFIDGIVRYHGVALKVFVDVDVQKRYLKADIEIKLAESLSFALKAGVEVGGQGLAGVVWWFEGELKAGIVTAIGDGIIEGINALEAHAKHAIDDAEKKITRRLSVLHDGMDKMKQELDELRLKSRAEVAKRRDEIERQNESMRRAYDEIDKLDRRYREVKSRKDSKDAEIEAQKRKLDRAKAELEDKKREMRREYDLKIQEQKEHQAHWKSEMERLKEKKEASWGDDLRKGESADRSWKWWCGQFYPPSLESVLRLSDPYMVGLELESERWKWKNACVWHLDNCHWWEKAYWVSLTLKAAHRQTHGSRCGSNTSFVDYQVERGHHRAGRGARQKGCRR